FQLIVTPIARSSGRFFLSAGTPTKAMDETTAETTAMVVTSAPAEPMGQATIETTTIAQPVPITTARASEGGGHDRKPDRLGGSRGELDQARSRDRNHPPGKTK